MGLILGSGGKGGRRGRQALNAEINVTPFVDVMLVLLIVFMITAPLLVRGEDIQNTEVTVDDLGAKLAAIIGEGYEQQMYLRADETVPYGRIMEVTSEVRAAGYTRLAFVTEQKK